MFVFGFCRLRLIGVGVGRVAPNAIHRDDGPAVSQPLCVVPWCAFQGTGQTKISSVTPRSFGSGRSAAGASSTAGKWGHPRGGIAFERLREDRTIAKFLCDTNVVRGLARGGRREFDRAKVRPLPGGLVFGRLPEDRTIPNVFGDTHVVWDRPWRRGRELVRGKVVPCPGGLASGRLREDRTIANFVGDTQVTH